MILHYIIQTMRHQRWGLTTADCHIYPQQETYGGHINIPCKQWAANDLNAAFSGAIIIILDKLIIDVNTPQDLSVCMRNKSNKKSTKQTILQ